MIHFAVDFTFNLLQVCGGKRFNGILKKKNASRLRKTQQLTHRFLYHTIVIRCLVRVDRFHKWPGAFVLLQKKGTIETQELTHHQTLQKRRETNGKYGLTCICLISFFKFSNSFVLSVFMLAKLIALFMWQFGQLYSSILFASHCRMPTQRPWNQSWHLSQQM